jgi:hypothetical protein
MALTGILATLFFFCIFRAEADILFVLIGNEGLARDRSVSSECCELKGYKTLLSSRLQRTNLNFTGKTRKFQNSLRTAVLVSMFFDAK